jgi:hypothetical protein
MSTADLLGIAFVLFAALFLALVAFYIRRRRARRLRSATLMVQSLQPEPGADTTAEEKIDDLPLLIDDLDVSLPGVQTSTFTIQPDENVVIVTVNGKNYDTLPAISDPGERRQAELLLGHLLRIRDSINAFENSDTAAGELEIFQKGDHIGYRVNGTDYDTLEEIGDPAARARAHLMLNELMRRLAQ